MIPLDWLMVSLHHYPGSLTRAFTWKHHLNLVGPVTIGTDASPRHMGTRFREGNQITAAFTSSISDSDLDRLEARGLDGSATQQIAEAFTILVALRFWHARWSS